MITIMMIIVFAIMETVSYHNIPPIIQANKYEVIRASIFLRVCEKKKND